MQFDLGLIGDAGRLVRNAPRTDTSDALGIMVALLMLFAALLVAVLYFIVFYRSRQCRSCSKPFAMVRTGKKMFPESKWHPHFERKCRHYGWSAYQDDYIR